MGPFLIFDTHPIQYRSPLFRKVCGQDATARVYYFGGAFDGNKWWFKERGAIPKQTWELPLTEGFPNETLPFSGMPILHRYRAIKSLLETQKPRAVLVFGYYLIENWILWFLCRQKGIAVVFLGETFQEDFTRLRTIVSRPLRRRFLAGLTKIVTIGTRNYRYYRGLGINETVLVPGKYAVNNDFFLMEPSAWLAARTRIRNELGIGPDDFVTLFVGRLFDRKRPKDLFHIHGAIKSPRHHTVVVGNGPQENFMKELARETPRFHLVGFKNQGETREFYCAADVLCVPSEFETWGLVVNEAFCAGVPAVVSEDCGVAGDLVTPGETGFIFAVGDTAAAARHITHLIEGTWDAKAMGQKAKARVRDEFSLQQLADAVISASR